MPSSRRRTCQPPAWRGTTKRVAPTIVTADFYKSPDEKVRPGDIVELGPTFRALKDVVHVGSQQIAKQQVTAKIFGVAGFEAAPRAILEGRADTKLVVPGTLSWAVLLTRGCDIDNGPQRQVAVIRPLTLLQDVAAKEAVILGKHSSLYYLPKPEPAAPSPLFEESFIDFRFVATLHRDAWDRLTRRVSLSRAALLDLYFAWMKHTIGPQVQRKAPCPACNTEIEMFQVVEDFLRPQPDY